MDPTACYPEMCESMNEGDLITARERAESLKAWLSCGGFYLRGNTKEEVDVFVAAMLRQTAARSNQ